MVTIILSFFYVLFILSIAILSFFMVTRLQEYSINPSFTKPLITLYIIITILLVIVNLILFFAIPFEDLLPMTPLNNMYY